LPLDRRHFLGALPLMAGALACNRSGKRIIGVVPKGTTSLFWQSVHAGAIAASQQFDVEVEWNGPTQETEYARQIQIVDAMINRRIDGIVLSPTERTALVSVVERAAREGIPVTIFDSGIDTENYVSYVATNNTAAGELAAETVSQLVGGAGKVALVKHAPGSDSTDSRERGFEAAVAKTHTGLEIVAEQYCMSDRAKALAVTEDMLTAHPDLDALFCSSEAATIGAARALVSRGAAGKIKLVGFDASPSLQQDLRDGVIDALVVQDPFSIGYIGVETIVDKLDGKTPEKHIDSPARVVRAADLDDPEVKNLLNPDLGKYIQPVGA